MKTSRWFQSEVIWLLRCRCWEMSIIKLNKNKCVIAEIKWIPLINSLIMCFTLLQNHNCLANYYLSCTPFGANTFHYTQENNKITLETNRPHSITLYDERFLTVGDACID